MIKDVHLPPLEGKERDEKEGDGGRKRGTNTGNAHKAVVYTSPGQQHWDATTLMIHMLR